MAFKAYENDGGLMKEGDYECIVVRAEETTTKTTYQPVIKLDFQVRSDVEQQYQRKHIFKNFYQNENGLWPETKIGKFANALGIEKDAEFDLPDLVGRCCILHMRPFTGQDGQTRDSIFYASKTKAGQMVQSVIPDPQGYEAVEDEDLPF